MSDQTHQQRIAEEEAHWNTPRMFFLGLGFLGLCLAVIFTMAYTSEPAPFHIIPWW